MTDADGAARTGRRAGPDARRGDGGDDGGLDARLTVRRGDGFTLRLDLQVEPGTTAALLGPNGAGKTTTVDALAGLTPIQGGRVRLAGRDLDEPAARVFVPPEGRRVGVVFQEYLLFAHLTVLDNVAFGPASRGESRREARRRARDWLATLDLEDLADRRPPELSGGQAQRVALARALAGEPDLLLLDEPLAALDVGTRTRLRRVLAGHLARFAGPRLLITHDPADAFLLADRIHVIEDGRLTQSGSPHDIRVHPATKYVAALAGTNLLSGSNDRGVLTLADHDLVLRTADTSTTGPVLITIHPAAIVLHPERPTGSARNRWDTTVALVEPLGDTTRVVLGDPVELAADVTPEAVRALGLAPGSPVWASVKATEIAVTPA